MLKTRFIQLITLIAALAMPACATIRSIVNPGSGNSDVKPISNPFNEYQPGTNNSANQTMILRTKKGANALEVEIPRANQDMSDFVIPLSAASRMSDRSPASETAQPIGEPAVEKPFQIRDAGPADREVTQNFPKGSDESNAQRQEIEQELGLVRAEDATPEKQKSYLAAIDQVKQLYRNGRYEAALLATDDLIRDYPTSPRVYEMRGTLFERIGQVDLALKAWRQALRFNPNNEPLKRFIERKEKKRSIASP